MRCTEARPLFSSYLDRAVSGTEMHDIFGHLEQCAGCQKEYALLEKYALAGFIAWTPSAPL